LLFFLSIEHFFQWFLFNILFLFHYNSTLRSSQDKASLNQNWPIIQINTGSRTIRKQQFTLKSTFPKNTTVYQKVAIIQQTIKLPTTTQRFPRVYHKFPTIHQKIQTCHWKRREEDQALKILPNQNFLPPERNLKM